jgi:caa(3)-type oxidase subunit IV
MTTATHDHAHDHGHGPGDHGHGAHEEHIHEPSYYIKTWAILLVLLVISILGPELEIRAVTLITAFGIAIVKAYLVCKRFMHLDIQPKYVVYFLVTAIAFMLLFFFAVAPDILKHHGTNWTNVGAIAEIERHGGKDGGGDVHEAAGHGDAHAAPAHGDHADVEVVNATLTQHREDAAKRLQGVDAAMKAVASELAAPPAPVPTEPAPVPTEPAPATP